MRHFLLTTYFTLFSIVAMSQYRYSIENCWEMSKNNYPAIKHLNLLEKTKAYSLSNVSELRMPQSVNSAPNNLTGVKNLTLGSLTNSNKTDGSLQANLFILSERVNNLFFSIILIDKQIKNSEVIQLQINELTKMFVSSKDPKVNNKVNIEALADLQEKTKADYYTLRNMHRLYLEMLSLMIGRKVDERTIFIEPDIDKYFSKTIGSNTIELIDYSKYNPLTSNVNIAPKYTNNTNNSNKVFNVATVKDTKKVTQNYSLDNLKKKLFNIDMAELKKDDKSNIDKIYLQIENDKKNIKMQKEIISVSYNKILQGEPDISNLTQGIISYAKMNRDMTSHTIQLIMNAYKFKFLYQ